MYSKRSNIVAAKLLAGNVAGVGKYYLRHWLNSISPLFRHHE